MSQQYDERFDPHNDFAGDAAGGDADGPPEGDCQVMPVADTVEIGWQKGKARCAFTVNLYRGDTLIASNTLFQGLETFECVGVRRQGRVPGHERGQAGGAKQNADKVRALRSHGLDP